MKGNNYFLNEENDNCERLSTFCANKFIHVKVIKTNTECSKENSVKMANDGNCNSFQ